MSYQKGINLGGFLSQCEHSREHYETFITEKDIQKIAGWGLDHVRIPIDYEVFETKSGEGREENYRLVEQVLGWCEKAGLSVIIDLHKAAGYDFNEVQTKGKNSLFEDEGLQQRFLGLWGKIAQHYGKYSFVAFELLNEVVNPEYVESWNKLIARTVAHIRQYAKDTLIIYGGVEWNSAKRVKFLEPVDENVMFTFHYYEPLLFTHQKAYWVAAMDPEQEIPYTDDMDWYRQQSEKLGLQGKPVVEARAAKMGVTFHEEMLEEAIEYARNLDVKLYCGEFGVIDRAPAEDTARWFADVVSLFEENEIGYAMWNYREKDFGILDEHYMELRRRLFRETYEID